MARKVLIWIVFLVVVANLVIVAVVLLGSGNPPPAPLPNPNGYDDFVKAGAMLIGNPSTNDTMSREELDAIIATNADAMKLLRLGLSRECREPIENSQDYGAKLEPELASFKQLLFLSFAEGRQAEMDGRTNDAAGIYLDGVRFGQEIGRGGLMISELVSIACENNAMNRLRRLIDSVASPKCREIAAGLEQINDREEPIADTLGHERLWSKRAFGLRGQFERLLTYKQQAKTTSLVVAKIQAAQLNRRRLIVAFAARAYQLEKGKPPQSMTDLLSDYLKAVPKDPVTGKDLVLGQ